jgi:glycogen operon protein
MDKTSGVRRKGTFTGVKEKLPYLKSLGINALLLMPCYDFLEQKPGRIPTKYEDAVKNGARVNYWGYTGGFYFVPKASYCATKQPHKEFAELVEACHKADMDLYMEFYFGKEAGPELISRVLYFWKQQYGVDGFSVTGEGLSPESLAKNPVFAETRLIFPYDNGGMQGEKPQTPCHIGVADSNFQSVSLSFLKSDENQLHGFMEANRRNPQGFSQVNYVANHNGFTLTDAVSYDFRHNEENGEGNRDGSWQNFSWNCGEEGPSKKKRVNALRYNQKRNAILMLYLAQGIPLLYAGDEQGNSQQGNNNAWCQDNEIGWVQYSQRKADKEFLQFVKAVIAFRKAHPVFAMEKQPRNTDYKAKGLPDLSYHGKHAWMINT